MPLPPRTIHRPELKHIQRLIERCLARENPITLEQLRCFLGNPTGPILPDLCLEAKKLPDNWGTEGKAVWDLAVTPDNQPCMVTKIDGRLNAVVYGDKTCTLHVDYRDGDQEYFYEVSVAGFNPCNEPFLVVTKFAVEFTMFDQKIHRAISQELIVGRAPSPGALPSDAVRDELIAGLKALRDKPAKTADSPLLTQPRPSMPIFEHVSPLFESDGRQLYYGVIGRHLYTMMIPAPEVPSP